MELSKAGERKIVKTIREIVSKNPELIADFDEDAAILDLDSGKYAVTTDMGMLDTHFLTDNPLKMGKKIVTSNATDLLAKGALPAFMLISVGFPGSYKLEFVKRLFRSMDDELRKHGAYLIGGDTNKSKTFVYSVTMIGRVLKPLLRGGAGTGDFVVLTGQIGNAAAGYIALKSGLKADPAFIRAQLEPEIDYRLCKKMIPKADSGIDISDGLAYELGEIARLSGKRIVIHWEKLPVNPKLQDFCKKNGLDIKDTVLHHGEDYQIVYTTPDHPTKGIIIGEVTQGEGVFLVKEGKYEKLEAKGYEHFRSN
jgi:thiamine-monophosphate kinase